MIWSDSNLILLFNLIKMLYFIIKNIFEIIIINKIENNMDEEINFDYIEILQTVIIVTTTFSVIGSSFIIIMYLWIQELRNFSKKLVFYLSISDLIFCFGQYLIINTKVLLNIIIVNLFIRWFMLIASIFNQFRSIGICILDHFYFIYCISSCN
jgi:hypothetical protein